MSKDKVDYKKVGQAFREVTGITPQPDGKTITDTDRLWFLMNYCEIEGFVNVERDRYDYATDCAEEHGREHAVAFDELEGFRRMVDAASEKYGGYRKAPKHPDCERWGFAKKESAQ